MAATYALLALALLAVGRAQVIPRQPTIQPVKPPFRCWTETVLVMRMELLVTPFWTGLVTRKQRWDGLLMIV